MAWSPGAFLFCRHDALKYGELENGRIKKSLDSQVTLWKAACLL